ncbi:MAG TPA: tRNA (N6-isopentenyl adenosine(37)-C2)-methylthiotransferase MiaB [Candidatus Bathyarchaeia archaeon]|nr:tRNA (N6-isopentenyl adenosine(37)-C2)-methylthiotransferase MiaB [Candidatus Bathyarchaeia archaeon]
MDSIRDREDRGPRSAEPASERSGRRVFLETYGCQMNAADSELIAGVLARHGYERTAEPAEADVLLINTCAIRERAEERVLARLSDLLRFKHQRPHVRLGLLGCVATHQRERLLDRAPFLDLIVGPDGYRDLPELIGSGDDPHVEVRLDRDETYADLLPVHAPGTRAWLSVMRGCDKFCSFCVVPYTRGRERSLPPGAVVAQVEAAVAAGKREVVLLGQTVNAYRAQGVDFGGLLRLVAQVEGLERIRFTSPHPSDVSESMIEAMACEAKVMPYLHLPVQSASDTVLERMERGYTISAYRALLDRVRASIPGVAVSTDVIVGFPGESEADFARTAELLDEARYDFAYLFKYSAREGTKAQRVLPDDVPEAEKLRRLELLIERQEAIGLERNRAWIGREVEVLVEGPARRPPGSSVGKSREFKTTVFSAADAVVGELVQVQVEDVTSHTLLGVRVRHA